ncbi:MAG TPA: serine/threonine-protein kinase [Burkholderiales bacterium]|jgi:serine/threonine protein kinase|nr:serine/threonine-protein kinase [Burkholderiales bacterium]
MTKIGKYDIVRELGKGATSAVYLARDPFANREVAIKLVRPEILRDQQQGRKYQKLFLTEASLAGKLSHPHIAAIYDAVADEEGSYLVMEYVAGGTLEPCIKPESLLEIKRVIEIAFKCCKALDYAHQHGIIHRDIKPANILLTGDSDIKITDFGAALTITADTTQISGIGSPAYMSPEQLKEEPLDHRSDMFSLGVVMYQLLTGHLPFKGSTGYSIVNQIINVDPPPPSTHRAGLPAAVDAIVRRALQKDRARRYATWDDFAQALAGVFEDLQRPEDPIPEAEKFSVLRRLSFFQAFSDVDLWQVLRIADWVRFANGSLVIREGDAGSSFFVLAAGEVRVTKQGKLLNILKAGECFGEMAYLGRREQHRTASVIAVQDVTAIEIRAEALAQATESCRHAFNAAFLDLLVSRLEAANTRLSQLLLDRRISIF